MQLQGILAKVTCGASSSGLTGPGTTLFLQTFEANKDNAFGAVQRIGPDAANAFQGNYYGSVPITGDSNGFTFFTRWGQPTGNTQNPTQFPATGKLVTQLAIYLDPSDAAFTNEGQKLHYSVALNKAGTAPTFNRDYIFSFGWYSTTDASLSDVTGEALWVSVSHNTGDPKDPNRGPVPITQAGWYYLQHVFYAKPCDTGALSGQQCVYADIKIFTASKGGACGAVYTHSPTGRTASWMLGSDKEETISTVRSPRSGWLIHHQTTAAWQPLMSIDSFSYRTF
ncbi:hypothetical protein OEZ85_009093 [Tetradesmus obliquus]|uniref:Uncharacterized protein n=1 Tax=Tetradesmus obliquus TaxID=3088 RepID=A0ABY8TLC1_TETOB|nr:hypothetical protein OEZ85_009093 [Tetradesmus obliquus]